MGDGKPHTMKHCKNRYTLRLTESGETKVTNAAWQDMMEQKVSRSRVSAASGADGFLQRMWERLTTKRNLAKHLLEEATKAVQLESRSSWQNESP